MSSARAGCPRWSPRRHYAHPLPMTRISLEMSSLLSIILFLILFVFNFALLLRIWYWRTILAYNHSRWSNLDCLLYDDDHWEFDLGAYGLQNLALSCKKKLSGNQLQIEEKVIQYHFFALTIDFESCLWGLLTRVTCVGWLNWRRDLLKKRWLWLSCSRCRKYFLF